MLIGDGARYVCDYVESMNYIFGMIPSRNRLAKYSH